MIVTSKRTNERTLPTIVLRGAAARRIAALFIQHGALSIKAIYSILSSSVIAPEFSKSAIRGVIKRFKAKKILLTDGYKYILNPFGGREILIAALGGIEDVRDEDSLAQVTSETPPSEPVRVKVDITPRWWSEVFDLPAAWIENTRLKTKIDQYLASAIIALCTHHPKRGDRSGKHRYFDDTFTLIVWPSGIVHIYTKNNPKWLDILGKWLRKGGLGPSDLRLIASAIERALPVSRSTLEIPLKRPADPVQEFVMTVETAEREATIRLVRSHYPQYGELEVTSDSRYIFDWLGMIAGTSIETMARSVEFEEIEQERTELKEDLDNMKEMLASLQEKMASYEETTEKLRADKKKLEEDRESRREKQPDYIG